MANSDFGIDDFETGLASDVRAILYDENNEYFSDFVDENDLIPGDIERQQWKPAVGSVDFLLQWPVRFMMIAVDWIGRRRSFL
ncbi:MAG: hypothetical protein R2824_31015 [Saprospiraceae bacterium]